MGDVTIVDFILRLLPESFIIILAGYAVSKKELKPKLYIIASLLLGVSNFIIKLLPVSQVIHMALSLLAAIAVLILINKIRILYSVISTFICFILTLITEAINILILSGIFGLDVSLVFETATNLMTNIYGLPSLILFALIVVMYYFISKRKKKNVDINQNI